MYEDQYHPQIKKDLKKIDKPIRLEIKEQIIPTILSNPTIGNELTYDLQGIYSYHLKKNQIDYRLCYIIKESDNIVYFLLIATRENFYDLLKRRMS